MASRYPEQVTIPNPASPQVFGESRPARLLAWPLFAGIAVVCALPVFSRESWLIFVQDDLLYYLQVARNIAHGHGSTFNGLVPTNGYQPLWLLVLLCVSYATEDGHRILAFIAFSNLVAALATFLLARSLLRTTGVRPLLVFALSSLVTLYSVSLFFYGMEVTLTVPILVGVVCLLRRVDWLTRGWLNTFLLGLLLSAMVLSRIDTLILGGMLLAGIVATPSLRRLVRPSLAVGLAAGLLPVVAYFLLSHHLFQTWLPVSGMAKELKFSRAPSLEPWKVFFHPLAAGYAIVVLTAFAVLPSVWKDSTAMDRILMPSILLFPFLYYMILSCVSDWTLWGWYMYPIRTALLVSFLIFCQRAPLAKLLQTPLVTYGLVLLVFASVAAMRWKRQQIDIYQASVEIASFAATHPGIYAMGDRAGRPAWLIDAPIVQTEGLMMDRDYLRLMKAQPPLRAALARYNVRYYIATAYEPYTGCFQAVEPAKAGPDSAHMRDTFCEKPLATFLHDGVTTLVYDLAVEKAK